MAYPEWVEHLTGIEDFEWQKYGIAIAVVAGKLSARRRESSYSFYYPSH
jgi:hypothetical protein